MKPVQVLQIYRARLVCLHLFAATHGNQLANLGLRLCNHRAYFVLDQLGGRKSLLSSMIESYTLFSLLSWKDKVD